MCVAVARVRRAAELVFFSTGPHLSVKTARVDGDTLVLTLRGGGEMICDASLVARIEPDEVPYPGAGAGSRRRRGAAPAR